ncbi:hypothetical protein [uncultured Sphingobacterium sp.]|uniref:hypothetical protein n=1 Tax=uncultured Sphingobacterium sp. TaxID=182688 RepID=UPI0025F36561|nr:hypothetical protein [uncultured Sphingobacterium sp.]
MKLIQWTLFLDMLGYGEMNGSIESDEQADQFISFMNQNAEIFKSQDNDSIKVGYKESNFNIYEYYDIQHALISDSLVITYKPKVLVKQISDQLYYLHSANALFIIAHRLQRYLYHCLEEKKIFIRGGISNKFAKIEGNFAVGSGIIEAYKIESKIAKYPRIVVSDEIVNNHKLVDAIRFLSIKLYAIPNLLVEENKVSFLDYARLMIRIGLQGELNFQNISIYHHFFTNHRDSIIYHTNITLKKIEELNNAGKIEEASIIKENVLAKYIWLKNYHNNAIKTFADERIERMYSIIEPVK